MRQTPCPTHRKAYTSYVLRNSGPERASFASMNRRRSSMADVTFHGIPPHGRRPFRCHPSTRYDLSPIKSVCTKPHVEMSGLCKIEMSGSDPADGYRACSFAVVVEMARAEVMRRTRARRRSAGRGFGWPFARTTCRAPRPNCRTRSRRVGYREALDDPPAGGDSSRRMNGTRCSSTWVEGQRRGDAEPALRCSS